MKTCAFRCVVAILVFSFLFSSCNGGRREESATARQLDTFTRVPLFNPYEVGEEPVFDIVTSMGTIRVKLYKETPLHRENFVRLAAGKFYDGVLFHRVIDGFMIQGGDPWTKDPCRDVREYGNGDLGYWIPAEFSPSIRHEKGALAAAREGDDVNPEKMSSSTQFYIVQDPEHCKHLDGNYTVFGQTVSGFEVIDAIAKVPTGKLMKDMPDSPVKILGVKLVGE